MKGTSDDGKSLPPSLRGYGTASHTVASFFSISAVLIHDESSFCSELPDHG